ncbi:MAG: hypothetical protein ACR2N5_07570 [Solirubrobacterales bacterium]
MAAAEDSKSNNGEGRRSGFRLNLSARQWVVAFLIGISTVFAASYGWRAAAIGSTAAFDDRQSISETISTEQQQLDVALAVTGDLGDYTQYLGDYAVAAELDNQADGLEANGDGAGARDNRQEADLLRRTTTQQAADAGVFGEYSIADDLEEPGEVARGFDLDDRVVARTAEEATGLDSPGQLDPDFWAQESEDIRDRINALAAWALILLIAVLLFTVGEANSNRRPILYAGLGLGVVALVAGAVGGMTGGFFA